MKKIILSLIVLSTILSCSKDESGTQNQKPEENVSISEIETLRKEVQELRELVETMTSLNDIEEIKNKLDSIPTNEDIDEVRGKVVELTSQYFEVDGLRFNKNGDIISTPKYDSEIVEKKSGGTHTTTRTYDGEGRLIELMKKYSNYSQGGQGLPYIWRQEMYEYNGNTVTTTQRTYKWGLSVYEDYEEVITTTVYW